MMSSKEVSLLPLYSVNQRPFPFVKLCKKYLPLIIISLLVTLSLLCYVFVPQIHIPSDGLIRRNYWSAMRQWSTADTTYSLTNTKTIINSNRNTNNNKFITNINNNKNSVINEYNSRTSVRDSVADGSAPQRTDRRAKAVVLGSGADANETVRAQRDYVKEMMKHSWDNYVRYAWGDNELKPLSRSGHNAEIFGGESRLGATIVDALDTLYIMNMSAEFELGRNWVEKYLSFDSVNSDVSVFETVIRFVGGLLSAYAFTNDPMFVSKARHVAQHMLPAFDTPTGLPLALINPMTGQSHNYGWASAGSSILAELGSLHLEFVYLSATTGDLRFREKVIKIRELMDKMTKPYDGLYINYINPTTGQWGEDQISVGALGDSYYEYLIKSWIQSNGTDLLARSLYDKAVDAIDKRLVKRSKNGFTYLAKQTFGQLEHKMEHLACFAGGMFAIGAAQDMSGDERRKLYYLELGANITDTCAQSYARTATGIGPEAFYFTELEEAVALNNNEKCYILRPEVIESYFYLWRLTHEQRFRDYAWTAAKAIAQHCRTENGFSGIRNVSDINSAKDDVQQTFFLAETLKYLYLIFSNDDLISLNDWVFNTEAHPFPILPYNTND